MHFENAQARRSFRGSQRLKGQSWNLRGSTLGPLACMDLSLTVLVGFLTMGMGRGQGMSLTLCLLLGPFSFYLVALSSLDIRVCALL